MAQRKHSQPRSDADRRAPRAPPLAPATAPTPAAAEEPRKRPHRMLRWGALGYLALLLLSAAGPLAQAPGARTVATVLPIAGLIALPLALLAVFAGRAWGAGWGRHLPTMAFGAVGLGLIALRGLEPTAASAWSLATLWIALLATSQPRLLPGALTAGLLWLTLAGSLYAGGAPLPTQWNEHLALLQATAVGVALHFALHHLYRVEAAARETLAGYRRQVEESHNSRARFIAAASHDLRQPLNAVAFLAQALRARLAGDPAEATLRRLEQAARSTDEMIRDLLDIAKLDAGAVSLVPQPVPLRPVFENVQSEYLPAAHGKGLSLHIYKTDLVCRSDPVALQRILSNLVANAVRYTDSGVVYLRAEALADDIRIRVRDTGVGIDPQDVAQLFEEFRQLRKDRGGSGLGLAIARRLCDALGHRIEVESVPGQGSAFTVVVQRQRPATGAEPGDALRTAPAARSGPPAQAAAAAGPVVVLIDADSARRAAARPTIESWGCTVVDAGSGAEAEEKLSGMVTVPDLMIVDRQLAAGETSEQAIARLREAYGKAIPSVAFGDRAADLDRATVQRALAQARQARPSRTPGS